MSKKNKPYGFPYDYSNKKPLYRFTKGSVEMLFYTEGNNYTLLQKVDGKQQRVHLNDVTLNNMLGMLDKNGFHQVSV